MSMPLYKIALVLGKMWNSNPELRDSISEALKKGGEYLREFYNKIKEEISD